MTAPAVLWYRMHVPHRVAPVVVAAPLAASLVAGTSVLLPITGTEFPLRLVTPAIVAALVAGVFLEPCGDIARTCPHPQERFRLTWSICVVVVVLLLHAPLAYELEQPPGVVVIRDSLLHLGIVLLATTFGSALFAWSAPIVYTGLLGFNARVLGDAGLTDTLGVPFADADSATAWLVTAGVVGAGLAAYTARGPRQRAGSDDVV